MRTKKLPNSKLIEIYNKHKPKNKQIFSYLIKKETGIFYAESSLAFLCAKLGLRRPIITRKFILKVYNKYKPADTHEFIEAFYKETGFNYSQPAVNEFIHKANLQSFLINRVKNIKKNRDMSRITEKRLKDFANINKIVDDFIKNNKTLDVSLIAHYCKLPVHRVHQFFAENRQFNIKKQGCVVKNLFRKSYTIDRQIATLLNWSFEEVQILRKIKKDLKENREKIEFKPTSGLQLQQQINLLKAGLRNGNL